MNKHQKLVQQAFLNNEEEVISRLQGIYGESLSGITKKVKVLDSSITQLQKALDSVTDDDIGELALAVLGSKKHLTPAEAQETIKSMIQSKVYQKQYQEALRKQVGGILDTMQEKQYKTVSDYLTECYEDGFIGTMYDLQGQGIPLCMPIDQQSMVRAVQLDSKISKGLYTRLGEDVATLKRKITSQISRGVASGLTYREMAQQLAGETRIGYNNAVRIARTEGHRIQCQAGMDACHRAQEKGCDVLKQWDATLDDVTRSSHAMVDGELRELDKPFSNGLMFPGDPKGGAAEVINCRCALLQRASWELDEEELEELKERAEFFGLDKTASFEEYKQKYLKAAESGGVEITTSRSTHRSETSEDGAIEIARIKVTPSGAEIIEYPLTNTGNSGKIQSGAVLGAYNNKNDPFGTKRFEHAVRYYVAMRNSKKADIVSAISKNTGIDDASVSRFFDHLLLNKYELDDEIKTFDPDYYIAESIRRLREGKGIQPHDLLLVRHEALEFDLMNNKGLTYAEAHRIANETFNYQEALNKWLDEQGEGG